MTDKSAQPADGKRKFRLGPCTSLPKALKNLSKTIQAMADGTIDHRLGAAICNGIAVARTLLDNDLEKRIAELERAIR